MRNLSDVVWSLVLLYSPVLNAEVDNSKVRCKPHPTIVTNDNMEDPGVRVP